VAFAGGPAIDAYLARAREVLTALGHWTAARLQAAGVPVHAPEGGFYLFPDFTGLSQSPSSEAFCTALLEENGVALLPGSDFGRPEAELTARLCYVDFDGAATLGGEPVDEAFLRARCPNVCEAVERLVTFLG
jgi:aspartate aminotransferase